MTAPQRAPVGSRRNTKILHIEDNPENRALVRALLEAEGYALIEAEDGLRGIEMALREEPALILLDINLPNVDGYEVVGYDPDGETVVLDRVLLREQFRLDEPR